MLSRAVAISLKTHLPTYQYSHLNMSLFLITADKSAVTVKKVYSSYNLLT